MWVGDCFFTIRLRACVLGMDADLQRGTASVRYVGSILEMLTIGVGKHLLGLTVICLSFSLQ